MADRCVHVQYAKYAWRVLHGHFGTSWPTISVGAPDSGTPVGPMIWRFSDGGRRGSVVGRPV